MSQIDAEITPCPECGGPVESLWVRGGGMLRGDYVLIADWVFHPGCWDAVMERNPIEPLQPGAGNDPFEQK